MLTIKNFHKMVSKQNLAILLTILSSVFFASVAVCLKLIPEVPILQKVLFRNFIVLIYSTLLLLPKGRGGFVGSKGNRKYLLLRAMAGLCAVIFYFIAISKQNLADVTALHKTAPFFVCLFSIIIFKEKASWIRIVSLIGSFIGIVMIVKPGFDLQFNNSYFALIAAFLSGISFTTIHFLKGKEEPRTILFWYSFLSTVFMLPISLRFWIPVDNRELIILVLTGTSATIGQLLLTISYQLSSATDISIYSFSHIIFGTVFGVIIFNEIPDKYSIYGIFLVIGMAILLFREIKQNSNDLKQVKQTLNIER